MKVKIFVTLVVAFALLTGCYPSGDGGDGGSPAANPSCDIDLNQYAPTTVVWWVDAAGDLHFDNTAEDPVEIAYNDHHDYVAKWNCADYTASDGVVYEKILVQLTFKDWASDNQGWILEKETFAPGLCEPTCL